jgi:spore maturation protein CgeB
MKFVIFGLTISSSWGNGHATLWRGLCRALHARGHQIVFFERDVPYYAKHRDLAQPSYANLVLYPEWETASARAAKECADADVAMVTSYCADGAAASDVVLSSRADEKLFYDLDTPITLERLSKGEAPDYIPANGLADFDLVLSYTGGRALRALQAQLGAKRTAPLYGSVDPQHHFRVPAEQRFCCDVSYLGTYAADRQAALVRLFIEPARHVRNKKFLVGGAQYPQDFPWTNNIFFVRHLPPQDHPAFFSSSRLTLNVTRKPMADMGYCPSGRLFEAAACGTPMITDAWEGLEEFYTPGKEILIARETKDTIDALELSDVELSRISNAAYQRTMDEHTASTRAAELENILHDSDLTKRAAHATTKLEPALSQTAIYS